MSVIYLTPETLEEALALRAEHGSQSLVMGGGTIVMSMMNEGVSLPDVTIGLKRAGLDTVGESDGSRVIGPMATMARIAADENAMLAVAASRCGGWAIKNMATIGGNLFVPGPAGDAGVALLALDAGLRFASTGGSRTVPIADFYRSGRSMGETELLTAIAIPTTQTETRFVKFGRKRGVTPSVVTVAVSLLRDDGTVIRARIALGAMGPEPVRAERAESMLVGNELSPELIEEVSIAAVEDFPGLTDAVASGWYRKRMASLHVKRVLEGLMHE